MLCVERVSAGEEDSANNSDELTVGAAKKTKEGTKHSASISTSSKRQQTPRPDERDSIMLLVTIKPRYFVHNLCSAPLFISPTLPRPDSSSDSDLGFQKGHGATPASEFFAGSLKEMERAHECFGLASGDVQALCGWRIDNHMTKYDMKRPQDFPPFLHVTFAESPSELTPSKSWSFARSRVGLSLNDARNQRKSTLRIENYLQRYSQIISCVVVTDASNVRHAFFFDNKQSTYMFVNRTEHLLQFSRSESGNSDEGMKPLPSSSQVQGVEEKKQTEGMEEEEKQHNDDDEENVGINFVDAMCFTEFEWDSDSSGMPNTTPPTSSASSSGGGGDGVFQSRALRDCIVLAAMGDQEWSRRIPLRPGRCVVKTHGQERIRFVIEVFI